MNKIKTDIARLLGRPQIDVDLTPAAEMLQQKRVMVTGAAGSIGSELARQLAAMLPAGLLLIDSAETPLHSLMLELVEKYGGGNNAAAQFLVDDCAESSAMRRVFDRFRPEVIFHAAAYKHVPMMELNPHAAVTNNVRSTKILADLAAEYGAERFVMISTDKAVNPTGVMGASKRVCELYVQSHPGGCHFITTRFGNVLGSQGSVLPLFERQLAAGGPLTVTHPEVRRFFMLIPEACRLVLLASALGHGGEIFAFDMGEAVRIADMARRLIVLAGRGHERIVFTGLRPGEKLYEEVLTADELTLEGPHPKIKVARIRPADYGEVSRQVEALIALGESAESSAGEIIEALGAIVPEFTHC